MDKFTVRRKILRGSLSAPVILTVASPGSLAAASTTCLANTPQTPAPAALKPFNTDDGYLRKTIQVYRLRPSNGGVTADHYYRAKDGFWYSVNGGQKFVGVVEQEKHEESREVLVYVDSLGKETGYGWPSTANGGSFTSIGCWHSLLIRP
jgi:hypothetical protein